jgi:protein TonB
MRLISLLAFVFLALPVRAQETPKPPPAGAATPSTGVRWEEQPTRGDYARFYPRDALRRGIRGVVTLDCLVREDYRLACEVVSEEPQGVGFAAASQEIARRFRIAETTSDGRSTLGGRVRRTIHWSFADE